MLDKILGVAEDNKKVFSKMDKTLETILKGNVDARKETQKANKEQANRDKANQQRLERLAGDKGIEAKKKDPLIETNKKLDGITELLEDLLDKKDKDKEDGGGGLEGAGLGAGVAGLLGSKGALVTGLTGLATAVAPFAAAAGAGALGLAGLKGLGEFFSGMKDGKQVKTSQGQEWQFGGNASIVAGIQRDAEESKDQFRGPRGGMDNDYQRRGGNEQAQAQGFVTPKQQDEQRQVYVKLFEDLNNERQEALKSSDIVKTVGSGRTRSKKTVQDKEKRAEINADFDARRDKLLQRYEELFGELEQIESRDAETPVAKARGGSVWKVPGSGSGDKPNPKTGKPYQLKPGSFVLNRNASSFLTRQEGGTVPAVLEPGELVFPQTTPSLKKLNNSVPRFQEGGEVDSGDTTDSGGFKLPLTKGRVGTADYQIFGAPRDGGSRIHAGVDLVETAPWGDNPMLPCVAAKDGEVLQEKYTSSGYVAGLIIRQNDGYDSRYVHMTPEVAPGTKVKAGDRLGKLIDLKDNSHLHYELYKNGSSKALDPTPYLQSAGKSSPSDAGSVTGMGDNPDGKTGEETGPARGDASTAAEDATKKDPKKGGALRDILAGVLGVGGAIGGAMLGNKIKELVPGYTVGGAFGMKMSPAMGMAILGAGLGGATANALTGGGGGEDSSQPEQPSDGTKTGNGTTDVSGGDTSGAYGEDALLKYAKSKGIQGVELQQFMAQMSHESGMFKHKTEIASGDAYEGSDVLGNNQPGDGKKYKGRGYVQLTGRWNYGHYGKMVGEDLVNNPELAADDEIALKIAYAYWDDRVRKGYGITDFSNTVAVTKAINGGNNGLADREAKFAAYQKKQLQRGGQVQALLEGGELVFPHATPQLEALNSAVPRFQTGGTVGMSGKPNQIKSDFMNESKSISNQPTVIVNNVSAPAPQPHGGEGPRPVSHSAPPTLNDGPNMAALSDIINRVGWSNVF